MNISDLTYFEDITGEELTGGSLRNRQYNFSKNVNIKEKVDVDVNIEGNLALLDVDSTAIGSFGTATEVIGGTYTDPGGSKSYVTATSATDRPRFW